MKLMCISLGCDKNLVDSEEMLGVLSDRGYQFTDDETEAEIMIINTCCFISDAKEESINTILEMAELKQTAGLKVLLVTGCLAQRYKEEILQQIPEVDGVLGVNHCKEIADALDTILGGQQFARYEEDDRTPLTTSQRVVTTGGHYAFLKIAEGCDKHCTYCVIPSVRGHYRSVPMEELVDQARSLVARGVKELILVAQETTLYGVDLYGEKKLPQLLRKLAAIEDLWWIRLQYCYPEEITQELIDVIAQESKICHYLDIPIQHASDAVLGRMGRKTDQNSLREIIGRLRQAIPDIALRTTLITGFPGESSEDHEENMAFIDEMEFERLGVFTYSREENTPAAAMKDQINEEVKQERMEELMELQQEIAFEKSRQMVGRELLVLVEGKVADENAYVSRTYMDAPGVDGYLFIQTPEELMTGEFARVRVTGALEYDLTGELI